MPRSGQRAGLASRSRRSFVAPAPAAGLTFRREAYASPRVQLTVEPHRTAFVKARLRALIEQGLTALRTAAPARRPASPDFAVERPGRKRARRFLRPMPRCCWPRPRRAIPRAGAAAGRCAAGIGCGREDRDRRPRLHQLPPGAGRLAAAGARHPRAGKRSAATPAAAARPWASNTFPPTPPARCMSATVAPG